MENPEIAIVLEDPDPLARRAKAILCDRIQGRTHARLTEGGASPSVVLAVAGDLPAEGYRIEDAPGGAVRVVGGSPRGLLYGVGKFLRTSVYQSGFSPSAWRGRESPQGTLRGMYYACHFHNWYHMASQEELLRYTEDLALWGANTIATVFPFVNLQGWDDPETSEALNQVCKVARAARDLGLAFCLLVCPNNLFKDAPSEVLAAPLPDPLKRHGNLGVNICPSIPAGRELILRTYRRLLEHLAPVGLDLLCTWPYDEGGCACGNCRPWGANGYLRISRDLAALAREYFPRLKIVLSTWTFDTPPEGEWEGLARALALEGGWVDYILADAHEDFPRYPLEAGVPGGLPLVNFAEISMWGNWPWGGWGAHVLPRRFQRLWDQAKGVLAGGLPYSEGIYEDMNKAILLQFFWDRDRQAEQTLREYIAYEFSPAVVEDVLKIIAAVEAAATCAMLKQPICHKEVEEACLLASAVDARLPEGARRSWRWDILRLRTVLDRERHVGGGAGTPAARQALVRLIEIYHAQPVLVDPLHRAVRPPLT